MNCQLTKQLKLLKETNLLSTPTILSYVLEEKISMFDPTFLELVNDTHDIHIELCKISEPILEENTYATKIIMLEQAIRVHKLQVPRILAFADMFHELTNYAYFCMYVCSLMSKITEDDELDGWADNLLSIKDKLDTMGPAASYEEFTGLVQRFNYDQVSGSGRLH